MTYIPKIIIVSILVAGLCGCMSADQHRASVEGKKGDRLTVGKVQREIRQGMSGAEVAQALGSPNIVSTDEMNLEVWIYDKISTTSVYSTSRGGVSTLIFGGGFIGSVPLFGRGSAHASGAAGAANTQQRTLTVVIKFDDTKKVREFAYHASRF